MSTEPPIPRRAREYVRQRFRPIPVNPATKAPIPPRWQDLVADAAQIEAWFSNGHAYNLGVVCGPQPSGVMLLAVDVDPRHGGDETWTRLVARWGSLPPGPVHRTPSGGMHLFFHVPEAACRTGQNTLGPGIDTRGVGGQVVVPPSRHVDPATGEVTLYSDDPSTSLLKVPVPNAPAWMVKMLLAAAPAEAPTRIPTTPTGVLSPLDQLKLSWNFRTEMEADDWQFSHQRGDQVFMTRPGKSTRDGHSAVIHLDSNHLVIWSSNAPRELSLPLRPSQINQDGSLSWSPGDYLAATRFDRDLSATASWWLRQQANSQPSAVGTLQETPETVPALPSGSLYLPDDFWSATTLLSEVREAALSRLRTPDAVLAALLSMYAATVPMAIWLPGLVGARAPLNIYAVVAGRSGGGKTSAMTIAGQLMGSPGNSDILLRKQLRSGEGLISLVNKPGRKGAKGEPDEPPTQNVGVHIHYDEGGTLSKQQNQTASTIIPYLNTAWSGAGTVGGAKAAGDEAFDASRVRICALIGVQYGIGANLFTGEAATLGFPQRLLFLSADDHPDVQHQEMPDEVLEPEPMGLPFLRHFEYPKPTFVEVPRPIRQEVWDWSKTIPDPLDAHAMNLQLRLAAVLMFMHGAGDAGFETWWALANTLMATHRDVRHAFVSSIQRVNDDRDDAIGRSLGRRQSAQHDYAVDRGVDSLMTKLGEQALPTRAIKDHFKSWRKRYGIDHRDVIDRALLLGKIIAEGSGYRKR